MFCAFVSVNHYVLLNLYDHLPTQRLSGGVVKNIKENMFMMPDKCLWNIGDGFVCCGISGRDVRVVVVVVVIAVRLVVITYL